MAEDTEDTGRVKDTEHATATEVGCGTTVAATAGQTQCRMTNTGTVQSVGTDGWANTALQLSLQLSRESTGKTTCSALSTISLTDETSYQHRNRNQMKLQLFAQLVDVCDGRDRN